MNEKFIYNGYISVEIRQVENFWKFMHLEKGLLYSVCSERGGGTFNHDNSEIRYEINIIGADFVL